MGTYDNPLRRTDHQLNGEYLEARVLQSGGNPAAALQKWRQLKDHCTPGSREELEAWRQLPVCYRLLGELDQAESEFHAAYDEAQARNYHDMAMRIAWDWSALLIERNDIDQAIALLERHDGLTESSDRLMLQAYLGRAYGRRSDDKSLPRTVRMHWRDRAVTSLQYAGSGLCSTDEADFRLDALLWAVELLPWWSPRSQPFVWRAAWQAARLGRWQRLLFDVPITFMTDYHGRNKVRQWRFKHRS